MDWIARAIFGDGWFPIRHDWQAQRIANLAGAPVVIQSAFTKRVVDVIWPEELGGGA